MDQRRRRSNAQEKEAARTFGAKQHAGSGSGARRHDMHTDDELIECKTVLRGNKQITLKAEDLDSLTYHAAVADVRPVLHVELETKRFKRWVLIPEDEYVELRDGGSDAADTHKDTDLDEESGA